MSVELRSDTQFPSFSHLESVQALGAFGDAFELDLSVFQVFRKKYSYGIGTVPELLFP
jgi:hypothetical protein